MTEQITTVAQARRALREIPGKWRIVTWQPRSAVAEASKGKPGEPGHIVIAVYAKDRKEAILQVVAAARAVQEAEG
jgi:hypothetical protein